MKKTMILVGAILLGMLTSCVETVQNSKLHVIFDNAEPRTMPLALFGEVPDSLVAALDIANGIHSSVSVMLVEKDGQEWLFAFASGVGRVGYAGIGHRCSVHHASAWRSYWWFGKGRSAGISASKTLHPVSGTERLDSNAGKHTIERKGDAGCVQGKPGDIHS